MESRNRLPESLSGMHWPATRLLLSEDAIKQAFIGFLKKFYKNRYEIEPGSFQSSLDNVSEGGLIADGMLRFNKSDGKVFTCAYEATSRDRIGEVRFTLNVAYFLWDCAAFGALLAAIVYTYFYITRLPWLIDLRFSGNLGLLLGTWLMGFLLWYFTLRRWRKYRYIYAIEQFKQYFADDQWVVLGEDVFPSPVDPYMVELREQCTYNGFGLATVDADSRVRVLVSPSRLDFYGKDRRIAEWVTKQQWYKAVTQNVQVLQGMSPTLPSTGQVWFNKIVRPIQYLVWEPVKKFLWSAMQQPLSDSNVAFERFMKGRQIQKWVFSLSLILIGVLGWYVSHFKEEETHLKYGDIREMYDGRNPEDYPFVLTEEPVPYYGGIAKQSPIREDNPMQMPFPETTPRPTPRRGPVKILPYDPKAKDSTSFDETMPEPQGACDALSGKGWIIIDNRYGSRENASTRMNDIKSIGYEAAVAPQYCIDKGKTGYVVYISDVFPGEQQAREVFARYKDALVDRNRTIPNVKPMLKRLD